MLMRWHPCSLPLFIVLHVAIARDEEAALPADDAETEPVYRTPRHMRLETQRSSERHMEIGPHGSLASVDAHSNDDVSAAARSPEAEPRVVTEAALPEEAATVWRAMGPKITGYKDEGCNVSVGIFQMPLGVDMTQDHCVPVRVTKPGNRTETKAHMKVTCGSDGIAKACIFHNDTSCKLSEPYCLMIKDEHTDRVPAGECVPATEHPNEADVFARFEDFPAETKWPECLVPPMTQTLMATVILAGVIAGLIFLCVFWAVFCILPGKAYRCCGWTCNTVLCCDFWRSCCFGGKQKYQEDFRESYHDGFKGGKGYPPRGVATFSGPGGQKGMMMKGGPDMMKGGPDPNMMKGGPDMMKGMMKGGPDMMKGGPDMMKGKGMPFDMKGKGMPFDPKGMMKGGPEMMKGGPDMMKGKGMPFDPKGKGMPFDPKGMMKGDPNMMGKGKVVH